MRCWIRQVLCDSHSCAGHLMEHLGDRHQAGWLRRYSYMEVRPTYVVFVKVTYVVTA